ncbi:MAG: DMT family transporter [bacterium]
MITDPSVPTDRPTAGILLCVAGLFLFSLQDIIIKHFSGDYSVLQIVFIRSLVALVPVFIIVLAVSGRRGLVAHKPKLLWLRGLLSFLAYLTYYLAVAALPLVDVVTMVFTAPILVTVMSAALLKETVGAARWMVVLIGFVAVIIVIGPSGEFAHLASALAFFAALTYAGSIIVTRFIGADDHPWSITLYSMYAFTASSIVAGIAVWLFGDVLATRDPSLQFLLRRWTMPPPADFALMIFLGLNSALALFCLIKAYCVSPASAVAPFEYTYLIWAVLFGYFIWGEVPRVTSLIGVALLIACGLQLLRREMRLARLANDTPRPPAAMQRKPLWRIARGWGN